MRLAWAAALICLLTMDAGSASRQKKFQSGRRSATLVELFTSEGCSSCPPADRWLSTFHKRRDLWRGVVPVGFHVTYWDYLGWPDRMASKAYTRRQRGYANAWGKWRVYTPGVVVSGEEWRGFFEGERLPAAGSEGGILTVSALPKRRFFVEFVPPEENVAAGYRVHAALLGFDMETKVERGENAGRTLVHNFVALSMTEGALKPQKGRYVRNIVLPPGLAEAPRYGVAVWVVPKGEYRPVQATGGYL